MNAAKRANAIGSTQRDSIKQHLLNGYSLTALEALSLFGAYRLAAHIEVLRNRDGMGILTTMSKDVTGRTYARYSLNVHMQEALNRINVKRGKSTFHFPGPKAQLETSYHAAH